MVVTLHYKINWLHFYHLYNELLLITKYKEQIYKIWL